MPARHPALRAGVTIVETVTRGETRFVVKDPESGRYLRMGPVEGRVLRAFDGRRSPQEIAQHLSAEGVRVSAATVEAFARACSRKGLLERTTTESSILQLERLRAERRRRRSLFRGELLRMRWSFGDPNARLERAMPLLRWCFTPAFVVGSLALVVLAMSLAISERGRLASDLAALASPANIGVGTVVLVWSTFLVVVLVHELGHAFACKHFGGDVREMGFMLVYFQPAFYANVTDAWSFPELRARMWVTAAGMWIEVTCAALAAVVWWLAQPGTLVADIALVVVFFGAGMAAVSNMNPLLPLDGYFALSDWLGISNLRQRGLAHWGWWVRRHVLRLDVPEPPTGTGERRTLLLYGGLACAYISLVLSATLLLVSAWAARRIGPSGWLLGAALAVVFTRATLRGWGASLAQAAALHSASALRALRRRHHRVSIPLAALVLLAAVVPWPITTSGPFQAASALTIPTALAAEGGVVTAVLVREGDRVAAGDPLLRLLDADALLTQEELSRDADSLRAVVARARSRDDAAGEGVAAAARDAASLLEDDSRRRIARRVVLSPSDGIVATARTERLLGSLLPAGAPTIALADPDSVELRIRLSGAGAALVRAGQPLGVISHADLAHPLEARVLSVSPRGESVHGRPTAVEARVRIVRSDAWRPGVTGEASVRVRESTLLGAFWWEVRSRLRTDLLL